MKDNIKQSTAVKRVNNFIFDENFQNVNAQYKVLEATQRSGCLPQFMLINVGGKWISEN